MAQRNNKHSIQKRAAVTLVLVLVLIFLVVGVRTKGGWMLAPLVRFLTDVSGAVEEVMDVPIQGIKHIYDRYIHLQEVAEENTRLRLEIERLKSELVQYREAQIENIRLRKLLEIKERWQVPPLVAHVVGADVTPWLDSVVIDVGRRAGVREGHILLAGAGVVGQVVKSGTFYSQAMLISDRNSAVAVIVQRSRARGILKGQGRGLCRMDYVAADADVKRGDLVVTAGLDGIFPKGLLVGEVVAVGQHHGEAGSLFKEVLVRPDADLSKLEEVLVTTPDAILKRQ